MKRRHHPLLAVVGLVVAGCMTAPTRGAASAQEVDTAVAAAERMTLAENETFERPLPAVDNALPAYPEGMLAHQLPPQAVCVRISIDEQGSVSGTAPISAGPDCAADTNAAPAFYEAAQQAAGSWRFEPAFRCVFPKGTKPQSHGCYGEDVKEVPQAVSLVYRFEFVQIDGKGLVRLAN